ncbi:GNAT family N-acetyltransferase [Inconstantimicrobium mannanitabidum]|uniref:Uncharacterized protein n=1 Tax=Inconstantimicrobium mannanitabidum TaxID=1604901 RepID=A0ACB5RAQ1_9CLOT|nr:GNAT family N-acetyltransferase [Clostridium sp. TW13]GKX66073.1 hypothetical protein rsdtw13_13310 [Clostridium sp. TW13]
MLDRFLSSEIEYTKKFAETYEDDEIIRFRDISLKDMYMHNFTLIKSKVSKDDFRKIIIQELEKRKSEDADFLRIECNFPIDDMDINEFPLVPEVTKYDYLYIEPKMSEYLHIKKNCIVKKALSGEVLNDGIKVDVLANEAAMSNEFACKRILRKSEVFKKLDSNLDLYVCYDNGIAIGDCELMINNEISKIEDFDIIKQYQRKGFGTSVLKYLLQESKEKNVEFAYLITNSAGTAKDMYKKCGFKKAGEKTELFFQLS